MPYVAAGHLSIIETIQCRNHINRLFFISVNGMLSYLPSTLKTEIIYPKIRQIIINTILLINNCIQLIILYMMSHGSTTLWMTCHKKIYTIHIQFHVCLLQPPAVYKYTGYIIALYTPVGLSCSHLSSFSANRANVDDIFG